MGPKQKRGPPGRGSGVTQVPELALWPLPAPARVAQQEAPSLGYISQESEAGKREVILKVIWP